MNCYTESILPMSKLWVVSLIGVILLVGRMVGNTDARDLMVPKEQRETEYDQIEAPSMDQQKRGSPQSMFVSIQMAKGYEVEWDSFGRQGWYTQDPRVKAIEPGTTVFTPDTPAIYIVFEAAPQEDPGQFSAQWYLQDEQGKTAETPLGRDALELPGHSRWGFLELKGPPEGWPKGKYLVKIFITPLGQQAFHAVNQVGTMRFTIVDQPAASGTSAAR